MKPADRIWWKPFRTIDGISVIHVDLGPDADHEAEAAAWLDGAEQERLRRFRIARPRREFALCRAALRASLCNLLDCANDRLSFGFHEHGKPFALVDGRPAPVGFNLSHSAPHGLIAFAARERRRGRSQGRPREQRQGQTQGQPQGQTQGQPQGQLRKRIGIDVERRRADRDLDGIAATVFGPEERAAVAAAWGEDKVRLFYRLWTLKEALIKALGTGFSLAPSGFEVPAAMIHGADSGSFRFPHRPADTWQLVCLGDAGLAAAIAYEIDGGSPETSARELQDRLAPGRGLEQRE